ncbi:2-iminoacetate synthase [Fusobacterium necrophorum subsp. necrophorum]|nr:2-iminoacetate synthase [Fusobacterium necrophorum subsp. necrophorum]
MSFTTKKRNGNSFDFSSYFTQVTEEDVLQSIKKEKLSEYDLLNLLSPMATKHLEKMAQRAHDLKLQHFGNVICLYIPIYVSNYCSNGCTYCGFSMKNNIHRRHMTLEEIEQEAKEIAKTKIEHIILLTGEVKDLSTLEYIKQGVSILKNIFPPFLWKLCSRDERICRIKRSRLGRNDHLSRNL